VSAVVAAVLVLAVLMLVLGPVLRLAVAASAAGTSSNRVVILRRAQEKNVIPDYIYCIQVSVGGHERIKADVGVTSALFQ